MNALCAPSVAMAAGSLASHSSERWAACLQRLGVPNRFLLRLLPGTRPTGETSELRELEAELVAASTRIAIALDAGQDETAAAAAERHLFEAVTFRPRPSVGVPWVQRAPVEVTR